MSKKRRVLSFLLVLSLVISGSFVFRIPADAAAKVTEKKFLSVLKKYDPDGYDFVQYAMKDGMDPLTYYSSGESLLDSMDDSVHEFCHIYSDWDLGFAGSDSTYSYRVDHGKDAVVSFDQHMVYYSNEMAQEVPAELRHKLDTYIGDNASTDMSANENGVYGMLDEFNAYGWGLNNDLCMYTYLTETSTKRNALEYLDWHGSNNIDAYYEYKLWFYMYMEHARVNYPDLYAYIGNNKSFIDAYNTVDKRISNSIKKYKKLVGDYGCDSYRKEILAVLKSDKYKEVDKALKGGGVDTEKYKWTEPVEWTSINWLNLGDEGIKLGWRSSRNADGYRIYRKMAGEKYSLLVELSSDDTTYTDKSVVGQSTYYYYIRPFVRNADGTVTMGTKSITRKKLLVGDVSLKKVSLKNGQFKVTWKKASDSRVQGYEVKFRVEPREPVTVVNGTTTIVHSFGSSTTRSVPGRNVTTLTMDPLYGDQTYYISLRGYFKKNGVMYYSRWSKEKEIKVG